MLTRHSFPHGNMRLAGAALLALVCLLSACSSAPTRSTASRDTGLRTRGASIQDPSAGLEEISIEAMALVGTPYRYGGNTPDSGFDCSGLVRYVVQRAAAVNLPRTAAEMGRRGTSLDRRDVASGDLVFFNTTGQPNSHVGIYVGQNRFVHAPATGGTVRLEDMTKSYWASRYVGARRVVAVSNLPDSPAPTAPMTPAPASPARPIDDDPLGTLARARDAQADSLMSTRGPATATTPAEDDPIARFATQ
ncbi:C40 family peptidase [Ralstonia pickettii]|uniref:C40 family peptidase n=1 Tax=Ralstonia pickettii TaxID=329 RepID=UPI0015C90451|nr:C40 family peptidase [Ralstonia pickettii]NYS08469.1 C40 family peptidase [Ralstonia pickettii]